MTRDNPYQAPKAVPSKSQSQKTISLLDYLRLALVGVSAFFLLLYASGVFLFALRFPPGVFMALEIISFVSSLGGGIFMIWAIAVRSQWAGWFSIIGIPLGVQAIPSMFRVFFAMSRGMMDATIRGLLVTCLFGLFAAITWFLYADAGPRKK